MHKLGLAQKKYHLKDITSTGSHISFVEGAKGYALSLLHWNLKYDETNLHMRYVEWAQEPGSLNSSEYGSSNLKNFFTNLKLLKTNNEREFKDANSRHIARILDVFSQNEDEVVQSIFNAYFTLTTKSKSLDIDAFIVATKKVLLEEVGQKAIKLSSIEANLAEQVLKANQFSPKLKNIMIDGIIWELALDLVKISAGPFGGACASLLLSFVGPAFKHIYEKKTLYGTIEAISNSWNQRILDDNSFHPLVEIIIRSSWIRLTWPFIDKLPNIATAGSILHTMINYGIVNFVLKYSTLNAFSTLKAELHKGTDYAIALYQAAEATIVGVIRGLNRNFLTPFTSWNGWDFITSSIALCFAHLIMQGLKNPSIMLKNIYEQRNVLSIIVLLGTIFSYNAQAIQQYFYNTTSTPLKP